MTKRVDTEKFKERNCSGKWFLRYINVDWKLVSYWKENCFFFEGEWNGLFVKIFLKRSVPGKGE